MIPSNPEDQKKVADALKEIVNSMVRQESEKDLVKEILTNLKEEQEIAPKTARAAARMLYKQNKDEIEGEFEEVFDLYAMAAKGQ